MYLKIITDLSSCFTPIFDSVNYQIAITVIKETDGVQLHVITWNGLAVYVLNYYVCLKR